MLVPQTLNLCELFLLFLAHHSLGLGLLSLIIALLAVLAVEQLGEELAPVYDGLFLFSLVPVLAGLCGVCYESYLADSRHWTFLSFSVYFLTFSGLIALLLATPYLFFRMVLSLVVLWEAEMGGLPPAEVSRDNKEELESLTGEAQELKATLAKLLRDYQQYKGDNK